MGDQLLFFNLDQSQEAKFIVLEKYHGDVVDKAEKLVGSFSTSIGSSQAFPDLSLRELLSAMLKHAPTQAGKEYAANAILATRYLDNPDQGLTRVACAWVEHLLLPSKQYSLSSSLQDTEQRIHDAVMNVRHPKLTVPVFEQLVFGLNDNGQNLVSVSRDPSLREKVRFKAELWC